MPEQPVPKTQLGGIAHREELIYGRRFGTALTLDVFTPQAPNGGGVLLFLSEGWYSDHAMIEAAIPGYIEPLLADGFTVFAVIHGSNPKYNIPESIEDARRAVRFVRHHAARFGVAPDRLGAIGDSAGAHLSLLVGCDRQEAKQSAQDPVDRELSTVAAVAAFFPPTDFLNWGREGALMIGDHPLVPLEAAFAFSTLDSQRNVFVPVTDLARKVEIARSISPIAHVHAGCAASLIVVGDADEYIPWQQSRSLAQRMKEVGAVHRLIIRPEGGHDADTIIAHLPDAREWFRMHLLNGGA